MRVPVMRELVTGRLVDVHVGPRPGRPHEPALDAMTPTALQPVQRFGLVPKRVGGSAQDCWLRHDLLEERIRKCS